MHAKRSDGDGDVHNDVTDMVSRGQISKNEIVADDVLEVSTPSGTPPFADSGSGDPTAASQRAVASSPESRTCSTEAAARRSARAS